MNISIVMGVYNGEDYLAEAIISILSQSLTNFEFIIVDDGSIGDCHNEGGGSSGIEDIQTEDSMTDID